MITPRATAPLAATLLLLCTLAACSAAVSNEDSEESPAVDTAARSTTSSSPSASESGLPTVPGYDVGEFPAVPLIRMPDFSVLSDEQQTISDTIDAAITEIPGLSIEPARCAGDGSLVRSNGTVLYGDGSGTYVGTDGTVQDYGDGSAVYQGDHERFEDYGDGSAVYDNGTVHIENYGDGSAVYDNGTVHIENYGDGSAVYDNGTVHIENYGDGSAVYDNGTVHIVNYGDGTGSINGVEVEIEPIVPVPALGTVPPLEALVPVAPVCGTLITLPDSVLFDFDSASLRTEAGPVLEAVAQALIAMPELASAITVAGHTDSLSDDNYNQTLSERRAQSVADALVDLGVATPLAVEGFGETQPVAENNINGQDNPAGRQLNRRVEIVIPA